jgi:hypothetical protein
MYPTKTEITVDGVSYKIDQLSAEARAHIASLQFVQAEIERLNNKLAVYTTAKNAYQNALINLVPRSRQ